MEATHTTHMDDIDADDRDDEPTNIYMQESFVNRSTNTTYGESDIMDSGTDDKGYLFRALRSEYGRCTSKIYVDVEGGPPKAVGWVFESRQEYERNYYGDEKPETYMREVWVTLYSGPEIVTRQRPNFL